MEKNILTLIHRARHQSNRGTVHLFLGDSFSDGCDKTTVEPGNIYSPGLMTCGVSVWAEINGQWYHPDALREDELQWGFGSESKCPPILDARYQFEALNIIHHLTHLGGEGAEGADFNDIEMESEVAVEVTLAIVVRDRGPAGAKISFLEWSDTEQALMIDRQLRLRVEEHPVDCVVVPADESFDSPMGLLQIRLSFEKGEKKHLRFTTEHAFATRAYSDYIPLERPYGQLSVEDGFRVAQESWKTQLPARVFAPDPRIAQVWERSAHHVLSNMECGIPRAGVLNYPVFWLRDCVLYLHTMDLFGRSDLARRGCDYLAPLHFSGGFGAEADAPGEGIWALVSHYEMTGDVAWLEKVFGSIVERVDWIKRMLTAKKTVRWLTENRLPAYVNSPGCNIVCFPAKNDVIQGRMDWGRPDFYINSWAYAGLTSAGKAARALGKVELADEWSAMAAALDTAIAAELLPNYGNDRDPVVAPHPSGVLKAERDALCVKFEAWYRQNRLTPQGNRSKEPLWTYFEAAQIHNAMQLGLADLGWVNLDGMLSDGEPWGISAYHEGPPGASECLPYRNGDSIRGWLDLKNAAGGNMPHLWTSCEMMMLLRNLLIEEKEGELILGQWVPDSWLQPGMSFGVKEMPTRFGPVSYTATTGANGKAKVDYSGAAPFRCGFPVENNL